MTAKSDEMKDAAEEKSKINLHDYRISMLEQNQMEIISGNKDVVKAIQKIETVISKLEENNKEFKELRESVEARFKPLENDSVKNKTERRIVYFIWTVVLAIALAITPVYYEHLNKTEKLDRHAEVEMRILDYIKTNHVHQ